MLDSYGRKITYLRLSVTDKCNIRCLYCRPNEDIFCKKNNNEITDDEIINICKAAVDLGITKIRITGGEPLIRENILKVLSNIREIDGLNELCVTTNATLLSKYAKDLKNIGIDRLNISVDSFDEEKYKYLTRGGDINEVKNGIDVALQQNFKKIKLNVVLIGDVNDDEIEEMVNITIDNDIEVRFIEMMPIIKSDVFTDKNYVKGSIVLSKLKDYEKLDNNEGVATLYKLKNAKGSFGIITPLSHSFCEKCNRIRVTYDGKVKPCLHNNIEFNLKNKNIEEIKEVLIEAIKNKPKEHKEMDYYKRSEANRNMNAIGG